MIIPNPEHSADRLQQLTPISHPVIRREYKQRLLIPVIVLNHPLHLLHNVVNHQQAVLVLPGKKNA